jgi:hypothetical protein
MELRIADTFTASLAKLRGEEQTAANTTAFDVQMNPANTGMQFHKLDRAKDKNFWSIRVSRIIVHRTDKSLLLCYAGHYDHALAYRAKLHGSLLAAVVYVNEACRLLFTGSTWSVAFLLSGDIPVDSLKA